MKRRVERPWGHKMKGGWALSRDSVLAALKGADGVTLGTVTVGTGPLCRILRDLDASDLLVKSNGRLEIETLDRRVVKTPEGHNRVQLRKARRQHLFSLVNGAWLRTPEVVVVLRPQRY